MYHVVPCSGRRCAIMVPGRPYPKPTGPMDQWLESQGYYWKLIVWDGSCLFKAVSEQVFKENLLKSTLEAVVHITLLSLSCKLYICSEQLQQKITKQSGLEILYVPLTLIIQ